LANQLPLTTATLKVNEGLQGVGKVSAAALYLAFVRAVTSLKFNFSVILSLFNDIWSSEIATAQ